MRKYSSLRLFSLIVCLTLVAAYLPSIPVQAQGPSQNPLPNPNLLLLYDKTTVALINTAATPVSLVGLTFWRSGGTVQFSVAGMASSLPPGHCIQLWTSAVSFIAKPPECTARDRYASTNKKETYFWVPDYPDEPFRPQLHGLALSVCNASAGRCAFYLPQGDDANKPWTVLDPATQKPMPAGIQVAFDADQLWIVNTLPDTVLPTIGLRLFYPFNGKPVIWQLPDGPWDDTQWDKKGIGAGECIVAYNDPSKITPFIPCKVVGRAHLADQPWRLKFEVMGPREERRSLCGDDTPPAGPTLCVIAG